VLVCAKTTGRSAEISATDEKVEDTMTTVDIY
jgi:hypothetical protein